ncbi:MAG: hypothetical protein DDG60_03065 [Anaerolineae bacterium]|nr:MAG: hypothetical protein DDG60_03065 [Anaerolineae bacterium]
MTFPVFSRHRRLAWIKIFIHGCFLSLWLTACWPAANPNAPYTPGFFYYALDSTSILFEDRSYRLPAPADCVFYALRPAPRGRWLAIEWDCPSGPRVGLFDSANGRIRLAINDQTLDNRLLAWHPDGGSVYLKIGMLSFPQIIRVDVETLKAVELSISAFVYDLAVSPDGKKTLYSLSNGIGFGSETWLGAENAQNPSQLWLEPRHIIALAQFSPDGSHIAYIKMPDSQQAYPAGELWIVNADGSNPMYIAVADAGRGYPPVWAPDGNKIAFVGRTDPADDRSRTLSIYDLQSGIVSVYPAVMVTPPAWSPDGELLTFTVRENDTITVWRYNVITEQKETIAPNACCAGWIR